MVEAFGTITTHHDIISARYNPQAFVERTWWIEEVARLRDDKDRRFLILVGEPGSGKSTFLGYLAEFWNCPRHFIRVDNISGTAGVDPRAFLISLGSQLYQKYGPDIFERGTSGNTRVTVGWTKDQAKVVGRFVDELYTLPFLPLQRDDVQVKVSVATGHSKVFGEQVRRLIDVTLALDVLTLLHVALINPLRKIKDLHPTEKVVILVDALDESVHHTGTSILDVLPQPTDADFPMNLRMAMTSRNGRHLDKFRSSDLLYLDDKTRGYWQANQQDIRSYIDKRLAETPFTNTMAAWKREEVDDYIAQVLEHSQNNFLYLYYFFNELSASVQSDSADLRNFGIPSGLSEIYRSFAVEKIRQKADSTIKITTTEAIPIALLAQLKAIQHISAVEVVECDLLLTANDSDRVTPVLLSLLSSAGVQIINFQTQKAEQIGVWEEKYLPILGVLAVAYEPLYREQIAGFARVEIVYVDSVLARLKQFLHEVVDEQASAYQFYHTSFGEYLLDGQQNRDFPLDRATYHAQIAFYCRMGRATWKEVDWETFTDRYLFRYLPAHLSELKNPDDLDALITLAHSDFVQHKIRHALDAAGADHDFFFFFHACLRLDDLPKALKLARQRVGIASLNDWLASDALAPVLRHLPPDSAFAIKMMGALEGIEPISQRAQQLIAFMRPGLPAIFYERLRAEFEHCSVLIDSNMLKDFLIAVSRSEDGAIDYVLGKAQYCSMSKSLAQAIIQHLGPLCRENQQWEDQALTTLGRLMSGNVEAFVVAVDSAVDEQNTNRALRILKALHLVLPTLESEQLGILGHIALAQAFTRHGETEQAKTLVRHCLEHIPPPFEDTILHTLYESRTREAGERLIQAAAPFLDLWERAVTEGRMLAARAQGPSSAALTLASLLRVTPAIPDPNQRIVWLTTILAEIRDFVAQDKSETVQGAQDIALDMAEAMGGLSATTALIKPLDQSIRDLYSDIDRILVDPEDLEPLLDLMHTWAELCDKTDENLILGFFRDVLPATARSTHLAVNVVTFTVFINSVAEQEELDINEAIAILDQVIITIVSIQPADRAILLLHGMFNYIEEKWSCYQPELSAMLATSLLDAVKKSRQPALLHAFAAFFRQCYDTASPVDRDLIWSQWATTHISLGEIATGQGMIDKLLHDRAPGEESLANAPLLRMLVASAFVNAGENAQACKLLHDTVTEPDLTNKVSLEDNLEFARILLRAGDQERVRTFIMAAAHRYRQLAENLSRDIGAVLLNGIATLNDHVLAEELLASAEAELLGGSYSDSAYAVRWYALLALTVSNELREAHTLWQNLSEWAIEYRRSEILITLAGITHAELYRKPWNDLLRRLHTNLEAIESTILYEEALTHVARLITTLSTSDLCAALINVLLEHASSLNKSGQSFQQILENLTQRLVTLGDVSLLEQAVDQMNHLFDRLLAQNTADVPVHYSYIVSQHLLTLSQSLPGGERLNTTLNSVILRCRPTGNLVIEALQQADQRMTPYARDVLLKHALSRIPDIEYDNYRTQAWVKCAEVLVQQPHSSEAMELTLQIVEALAIDRAPDDMRLVARARIYQFCVQGSLPGTTTEELERRVRTEGRPERVSTQVAWASALLPTPLKMEAQLVVDELHADLNCFAAPGELDALKELLAIGIELRPLDAPQRFLVTANWAVAMPLVTNEDWRAKVFLDILSATTMLALPQREEVQSQVLPCMWEVLPETMHKWFCQRLMHIPLETEVTVVTLARYLEAADTNGTQTPAEKLEDLICECGPNVANFTASVLCKLLDRYDLPIRLKRRENLARIAYKCSDHELKRRLDMVLRQSYELQGVADLRHWELFFLAHMPVEWWIEHFTRISLTNIWRDSLISWIEYCASEVPANASAAVIIATAWASRDIPDELDNLWFELATSESSIPLAVRSALIDMLIA